MLLGVLIILVFSLGKIDVLTRYADSIFAPRVYEDTNDGLEEQRQQYYDMIAGFWVHESDFLYDKIELKDNGIIWQHSKMTFLFPYNVYGNIERVSTSYLMPVKIDNDRSAVSNQRVIRETWIKENICYGRNFYDLLTNTDYRNDTLFVEGISYIRYEGEIENFFEEGVLDLVDDIKLRRCTFGFPLQDWLRENISNSFDARDIPFDALKFEQEELVKKFYVPYCLGRTESAMTVGKSYNVELEIVISPDGTVSSCKVRSSDLLSTVSRRPVVNEVMRWRFPTDGEHGNVIKYKGSFIKKQF